MSNENMMDEALLHAIATLAADSGTIHLKDPDARILRLAASHAIPERVLEVTRVIPWGKGMAGLAAERAMPVDACNLQTTTSTDVRPGARATGVLGAIVVPMIRHGEVVGTIGIGCMRERTFTEDETRWLLGYAAALAERCEAPPA